MQSADWADVIYVLNKIELYQNRDDYDECELEFILELWVYNCLLKVNWMNITYLNRMITAACSEM